jgi:hypothetical protein
MICWRKPAAPETHGTVDLRISCKSTIQPDFNRAVAPMHSFRFGPAIGGPVFSRRYWGATLVRLHIVRTVMPVAAGASWHVQCHHGPSVENHI